MLDFGLPFSRATNLQTNSKPFALTRTEEGLECTHASYAKRHKLIQESFVVSW